MHPPSRSLRIARLVVNPFIKVEIKTTQMGTNIGYLVIVYKAVSHQHFCRDSKAGREIREL
jgi:hypothetical protein